MTRKWKSIWELHNYLLDLPSSLFTVKQIRELMEHVPSWPSLEDIYNSLKLPNDNFLEGETNALKGNSDS